LAQTELTPGLYVVATPIGNLADISMRALSVLHEADRVFCEDTRVTGKLMARYRISTSLGA
jgi:16S rRNA (cytidine1402-2'-O)-methyltransferase